ncbi:MAG: hypothetical protein QUS12_01025 [Methanosarcina sp.]|nr:hypothetical protein [Methanosarcina sp.]MDM7917732.1 hypothetical protein [Methanosarcina sp.]HOW13380.1 hypothetical protein [Methanosarcina sp.]
MSKKEASNQIFYKTEKENQKLTLKQKELKGWISMGVGNISEENVTELME